MASSCHLPFDNGCLVHIALGGSHEDAVGVIMNLNFTEWFLVIWAAVFCLYAVGAAIFLPTSHTISATLAKAARLYPVMPLILGLVIGMLLGHVFWGNE